MSVVNRAFYFGLACFALGWLSAGLLEAYGASVWAGVLVLVAALFVIAIAVERWMR